MRTRTLAAWIWTGLLLVACWIPDRWLHEDESRLQLGISHLDKVVHGALFAGFGFLWGRLLGMRGRTAWVFAVGIALAAITELGQATAMIGRDADPLDALADVAGVVLGIGAAWFADRSAADREREPQEETAAVSAERSRMRRKLFDRATLMGAGPSDSESGAASKCRT